MIARADLWSQPSAVDRLPSERVMDDEAFGRELWKMKSYIAAVARSYTHGNREEADDLVADVFVKAWQARARWTYGETMKPWLATITARLAITRIKKAARRRLMTFTDAEFREGQVRAPTDPEGGLSAEIQRALDRTPARYRASLILFADGLSYEEIARHVGCPIGTVMSRLSRARIAMMRELGPHREELGVRG